MFQGDIESEGLTEQKFKEEDLDLDSMDHLDYEQYSQGNPLDMSDVVISTDLSEIVESICKDGGFPDSPPDSGSEHLLSPSSMVNPESVGGYTNVGANIGADEYYLANNHMRSNNPRDYTNTNMLPDLSKINYTVPMQMIEEDYKVKSRFFKNRELYIDLISLKIQIVGRSNFFCPVFFFIFIFSKKKLNIDT